ncbi:adaptor protein MecA [Bacillus sp. AGMB 02131]|uniref:Adaptor protein MecA n=1 Tax=Peribacillus faecalis TaxID=2772559 RepID=A0A927HCT1_9BACI|nr:adaptor protein MecA [Peribacillus faecalis]MBD3110364.1 adaptor protein MecA [Peribacillus faecalis]
MRLERVDDCTLKIFLTFDDLLEKGLSVTDITTSNDDAQNIIHEMIEWASEETGFPLVGAVEMEIYSQFTQGLVILIKTNEDWFYDENERVADCMKMHDEKKLIYRFACIEHVLSLFRVITNKQIALKSSLLYYDDFYYVIFEEITGKERYDLGAIAAEYGEASSLSFHQIDEYGSQLIRENAIEQMNLYFKK